MSVEFSTKDRAGIRPAVLVSRCLSFEHCRWNGDIIASPSIEKMKAFVDFITVCPESDIGLGVPRKPVRLVHQGAGIVMVQHESGKNCTVEMNDFSAKFLSSMFPADGFLYKERSPSCGMSNVKIYAGFEQYRQKKIPLSVCSAVIRSWIVRFDEKYLAQQFFFSPYPEALAELSDSGK